MVYSPSLMRTFWAKLVVSKSIAGRQRAHRGANDSTPCKHCALDGQVIMDIAYSKETQDDSFKNMLVCQRSEDSTCVYFDERKGIILILSNIG